MTTRIEVYYDYLCLYTFRLFTLLERIGPAVEGGLDVEWKAFSIEQQNSAKGADFYLWEHPEQPSMGIRALAASKAAMAQGDDLFLNFHRAVFMARHRESKNIASPQVLSEIAQHAGLDMTRFAQDAFSPETRQAVGRDHLYGKKRHNLFGVPTLTVSDTAPVYLKISAIPDSDEEQRSLFDLIIHAAIKRPYLAEIKRPEPVLL
jgi:predicted DsbA family dithiol-disulfide isomerase